MIRYYTIPNFLKTLKWNTRHHCSSKAAKLRESKLKGLKKKLLFSFQEGHFYYIKFGCSRYQQHSFSFWPLTRISRSFTTLWVGRMHNILFEILNSGSINFCLVKGVAARLRYFNLGQTYPIYVVLMHWSCISIAQHRMFSQCVDLIIQRLW